MKKDNRLKRLSPWQKQMLDDDLMNLLDKYLEGNLSAEERRAVEQRVDEAHQQLNDNTLSDKEVEKSVKRLLRNVAGRMNIEIFPHRKSTSLSWIQYGGIAAAIALIITISLPLLKNNEANQAAFPELIEQAATVQQFITDGNMKKITLADGSVVHLNMGTTLSLHKGKFNGQIREVWLEEGEAFFEVTKDTHRPFIVHTADGLSTRVLGTSFNIKAYRELGEQVVSVKTGQVQVSRESGGKVVLEANNKVSFDNGTGSLTSGLTDGSAAADWRTGNIVMDEAGLKEIALRLKQYYNVEIINDAHITTDQKVFFAFTTNTELKDVARALADIYKTQYRISNNKLILIK
jgi:ferric-dicitrate binding protein FerR (iron transport regulator)